MPNQHKQTLIAGAAVPVPGAERAAPPSPPTPPQAFAEGSKIQKIAEEFDALTAAMLPESLDEAGSDWAEPDLTGLDGNIVLCDLAGDGSEALAPTAPAMPVAAPARPVTMGVPKFDQEPELELDVTVEPVRDSSPQAPPPVPTRRPPPLPAPAQLAAATARTGRRGPTVPPPIPADARAARPSAQRGALAATVPAGAAAVAAGPPPIPADASASNSFSAELSRGGASVHTFPIVRAGFVLAGLVATCAVAWFFVLS